MARIGFITGLGAGALALMPSALALEPLANQLSYEEVANFATPGAVWCFEPQDDTCSFITLSTEPIKQNPRYDVIELWDAETVMTTQTGGVLRRDGVICERGTDFIDSALGADLDGVPVSASRLEEMKAEMRANWTGYEQIDYCYAYVPHSSGRDGMFDQVLFIDGELSDGALTFVIDYSANAIDAYHLRWEKPAVAK